MKVRRSRRFGPGRILGLLIAIVVVGGILAAARFLATGGDPAAARGKAAIFKVRPGEPLAAVATRLQADGLLRSALYLRLLADVQHDAADIQAGTYLFSGRENAREILRALVEGDVATHRLTIPEGYTISDIAFRLQRHGIMSVAAFVAMAKDFTNPFIPKGAPVRYRLEGYAFPATYDVPYGISPQGLGAMLFAQWQRQFTPALRQRARAEHLTVNQVMTIASMVEKEAKLGSERARIAAVFLNRLHSGMPMQSDPTVGYAMRRLIDHVTIADEHYPSPYNTYYTKSLPPGPICNPGLPSIEAVLHPAHVGYLYFYGLPNGSHIFSYTYQEQLAAERAHP